MALNRHRAPARRPFGGYEESGNGREWGRYGFEDTLETKSIFGYWPSA